MNFEKYKLIMQIQYELLDGLYFNNKIEKNGYNIYESNTITDSFWNIATLNKEDALDNTFTLTDIEQHFKIINRQPSIFIPRIINKYAEYRNNLISNDYKINDTDAYMSFVHSNEGVSIVDNIEKVKTNKQYDDFMEVMESAYGGEVTDANPYAGSITNEYYAAIKKSLDNNKFSHFILYKNEIPASIATLSYKNGYGEINNVGTKKEYQNIGLGSQIIKHCINTFNDIDGNKLFLTTEFNSKNEKWYIEQGFKTLFVNEQYIKI